MPVEVSTCWLTSVARFEKPWLTPPFKPPPCNADVRHCSTPGGGHPFTMQHGPSAAFPKSRSARVDLLCNGACMCRDVQGCAQKWHACDAHHNSIIQRDRKGVFCAGKRAPGGGRRCSTREFSSTTLAVFKSTTVPSFVLFARMNARSQKREAALERHFDMAINCKFFTLIPTFAPFSPSNTCLLVLSPKTP